MKKILIVIVILVALVLVSPGVIDSIAEDYRQQSYALSAEDMEASGLGFESVSIDRSWFVTHSVDRLKLTDPDAKATIVEAFKLSSADELPEIVIKTRIDHGLVPVTSLSRDGGTLMPSLGSTVSTAHIELANGDTIDFPGEAYGRISIGGRIDSSYALEAGTGRLADLVEGDATPPPEMGALVMNWGDGTIDTSLHTRSGRTVIDMNVDSFGIDAVDGSFRLGGMRVSLDQTPSKFGFDVGDFDWQISWVEASEAGSPTIAFGPMSMTGSSSLDGDRVSGDTQFSVEGSGLPQVGDASLTMDISVDGLSGTPLADVIDTLNAADDDVDPQTLYAVVGPDLESLMSAGFDLDIRQLDVTLPQGTVDTNLSVTLPETDPGDFSWGNILRAMSGEANLSVPAPLMDMVFMMNPQAQMAVGMGFLRQNGDNYEMEALYEQGLLTVNGAPFPLPLPQ